MCVCVCVWLCVCVCVFTPVAGVVMGVAFCQKVHNFQMDSQICTKFSGKVDYEPKDS